MTQQFSATPWINGGMIRRDIGNTGAGWAILSSAQNNRRAIYLGLRPRDTRGLTDVQKLKAFRHSAINIDWTACICCQIKTNFLWNFRGPPTHASQVAWSVKHNLAPKMSTLTETSFGFGILSMKKKEERNHFPPRVSPGQLLFRRNQLDGF